VQGICCSSETSQILAILQPIIGIQSVRVNAQLKSVMVEHDPSLVQATDIQKALDRERFKSRITEDGGMVMGDLHLVSQSREEEQDQESKKRSQFFVENICCAAEIRPIRSILETMDGIHEVSINVTTKMVYVRHDVSIVAASEIESRLNKQGFRTQILVDVARVQKPMVTEAEGKTESTLESVDDSVEIHTSKLNPLIIISGLFWIISMFSYIGGSW
jgi:copper chaperone CopZ